ncbi:nuclease-related domain-containing protein [Calidifontibacillus oryziterrae]|uniref:nuclease-related domain-containing protein n=1 Tax=Calidifontibacillus oryziterrae TaxID=1191699 RepID=UPI000300D523|nr:nuclease-related domain-containing protein [Calidifontibacillus oryziterrae]
MIKKPFKAPIKIKKLEALLRRLPVNHPKRLEIEEELSRSVAGFKGEQSLEYYLSFLDKEKFHIFHNIRLSFNQYYFQQDILILSPNYFLIIEAKNISGILTIDPSLNQMIRLVNGEETIMPDPILQVKHQQFQFEKWLNHYKYANVPIESIVVMTNPYTIIKYTSEDLEYKNKIVRSTKLPIKIASYNNHHKNPLSASELCKISNFINKHHTPYDPDILTKYNLLIDDILPGVICSHCNYRPMIRAWGKWSCPKCSYISNDAHIEALNDYILLFQSTITNHQLRWFLQLPSIRVANYILTSSNLNLTFTGTNKGRYYSLTYPVKQNLK